MNYYNVIGWIVWALGVYGAILMSSIMREKVEKGPSPTPPTMFWLSFWWVILVIFLFIDWNKIHLVWVVLLLIPSSFIVAYIPIINYILGIVVTPIWMLVTLGCKNKEGLNRY